MSDPYQICTSDQFNNIGAKPEYMDKFFSVMSDIHFGGKPVNMIGSDVEPFGGAFYGNHFRLRNVNIMRSPSDTGPTGVFARIGVHGYVRGVQVRDAMIKSPPSASPTVYGVGGIAGVSAGEIHDSSFHGTIEGYSEVGGVVGRLEANGGVYYSSSAGIVRGQYSAIGGLVGRVSVNANSVNPSAYVNVMHSSTQALVYGFNNSYDIGGLIGNVGLYQDPGMTANANIMYNFSGAEVFGAYGPAGGRAYW
jgi:hypothetical protein